VGSGWWRGDGWLNRALGSGVGDGVGVGGWALGCLSWRIVLALRLSRLR
jgi:hypothetical protein